MEIEPRSMSREMGELQIKEMWEAVNDSLCDLPGDEADRALDSAHKAEAKLRARLDIWDSAEKVAPDLFNALTKVCDQLAKNNQYFSKTGEGTPELFESNGAAYCLGVAALAKVTE